MTTKELADRIQFELAGIAEDELTKAEKNILTIINKILNKRKENLNAQNKT